MADSEQNECVRGDSEDAYFIAANSAKGFRSWYGETFDDRRIGRVYAIKGGPGTGKSRFLREVANAGAAHGYRAEMIYCSSDPYSLDGVILSRAGEHGIALLDATAPHLYELHRPGYREELVDLGAFWSAERLRAESETLEEWNVAKSEAYRRAYRYLSGYGDMSANAEELTAPYLRTDSIARFAARLTNGLAEGNEFAPRIALLRGVGMRGRVMFDTFFAQADRILLIEDCHGSAYVLMREIYRCIAQKKLSVRVSRDPILTERTDALYLPDCRTVFAALPECVCRYPHRLLSMRRFVDTRGLRRVKVSLNYAERVRRVMLSGAIAELERARDLHFQLESIYEKAMDFAAKESFTKAFCARLFDEEG